MAEKELSVPQDEFLMEMVRFLSLEVLQLRLEVARLKSESPDEMADETVGFMTRFLGVFPEEMRPHLREQLSREIAQYAEQGS